MSFPKNDCAQGVPTMTPLKTQSDVVTPATVSLAVRPVVGS